MHYALHILVAGLVVAAICDCTLAGASPTEPSQPASAARTYWVSVKGDDASDGSADRPWATLQHAADRVTAGDTVVVRAGAYAGFVLGWDGKKGGDEGALITFRAEPDVLITGRNAKTPDGINLEGASFIVIDGFNINNASGSIERAGIRATSNRHVTIRHNTCDSAGRWGIYSSHGDDLTVEQNVASRAKIEHGIYVANSCLRPVVRANVIWGNRLAGIHLNGDLSQGGTGVISEALIENNIIHDNGAAGASGINCDGVVNSRILNNLLYANHSSGISLYAQDASGGSVGNLVAHNTVVMAPDSRWALNIKNRSVKNIVCNNILCNLSPKRGSITIDADSLDGFVSDYNAVKDVFSCDDGETFVHLSVWRRQTQQDQHSIVVQPASIFAAPASNDYHLMSGSPAVGKGGDIAAVSALLPDRDLDGKQRPSGTPRDPGAYVANR